ncbi:MAG: peptide ABC transporter permease [Spirochaetes bacterium GWD1_61_31]|nr:MAG: peptide ABC transporter permease [Spirochaetes bacterium GWB1_60_80]OHD28489.1 MAG: peptide ABC transporter permease [Spirochaetes bacterium GWC1_61_12]OHD40106.1 MAG: peptide ABC transporter permease [Spirochaetes bacterium GWD1_61_31]OHD45846.1 MAG: peptide ABC transporter permease [Spirochaetes bacterium GWE1_60_18]OHD58389.1 MAG: peptide ABC transporter permease [Spirochaetes bacterium GWF1_60_12]HAW85367.1 ABC transporter permease [Spirochaetaceae bacterium]
MSDNKFQFTGNTYSDVETARPSLTYWQDAWRRLKKNKLSMAGLIVIFLILLFGIVGPMFSPYSYSEQINKYKNLPPSLSLYKLGDIYLYSSNDYNLFLVEGNGRVIDKIELDRSRRDIPNKIYTYVLNGEDIKLNFSYKMLPAAQRLDYDFTLEYRGEIATQPDRTRPNILFPFGTDDLGRDLLTRVMYGARISLLVAFIATVVNLFIGVIYGSISGYEGGRVDDIMMRIVDIINSVPLTLYVILLMVWFRGGGLINIIIALSSVFWVNEARLVRGQVLSLKEQEFVLAARIIGVPKMKIILRHLIPNAIGPIIVSMAMMIPSAIFTESFLSFIGLGVSAPQSSWGTLANNALSGLTTYPYQLFFPAMAIALTLLAFNFIGDGLRDALDPRLRK